MDSDLVAIGKVVRPHRRRGEVRILPLTDFPERFSNLERVFLVREGSTESLTVERAELSGRTVILKFADIDTVGDAWKLVGSTVEIPEEELVSLPEGTYYIFQLIGLRVLTEEGDFLGELSEVLSTPANDVYIVKREGGETLIPAIESVVKSIDMEKGEMIVSPIPGLLD